MDAKEIIKKHLDGMAERDEAFRAAYANPKKNLEDCFTYILNQARTHGTSVCMSDEEVFGMVVHYYVEENIEVGKRPRVDVVARDNQKIAEANRKALELTDEEKDKLKKQAEEIFLNAQVEELRKKAEVEAKKQREAANAREKKQKEKEAERLAKKREEKERATAGMGMLFEF